MQVKLFQAAAARALARIVWMLTEPKLMPAAVDGDVDVHLRPAVVAAVQVQAGVDLVGGDRVGGPRLAGTFAEDSGIRT